MAPPTGQVRRPHRCPSGPSGSPKNHAVRQGRGAPGGIERRSASKAAVKRRDRTGVRDVAPVRVDWCEAPSSVASLGGTHCCDLRQLGGASPSALRRSGLLYLPGRSRLQPCFKASRWPAPRKSGPRTTTASLCVEASDLPAFGWADVNVPLSPGSSTGCGCRRPAVSHGRESS